MIVDLFCSISWSVLGIDALDQRLAAEFDIQTATYAAALASGPPDVAAALTAAGGNDFKKKV